jgi:3-oxoacyl-[acyl-carrier protein] reductase
LPRLSRLSRSIAGSAAIVTGAGSGMGRATAYLLAHEGAGVAVVDIDPARVDTVVNGITDAGGSASGWVMDLATPAGIRELVDSVVDRFGRLDILVNNAGVSIHTPVGIDDDEFARAWSKTIAVNLTAHALMIRAAFPHLERSPSPRIVNIASTEGLIATGGIPAYTASKQESSG